jgi:hypothetical protein
VKAGVQMVGQQTSALTIVPINHSNGQYQHLPVISDSFSIFTTKQSKRHSREEFTV